MAAIDTKKHDWADDDEVEDQGPEQLPPTQEIQNKDGTKTIISYTLNDQNQKVKTTRRIRLIRQTEKLNPRVADRKTWAKFGASANDPPGPNKNTTTVAENMIFKPSMNWRKDEKAEANDPNAQAMKDKLRDKQVKCRICSGEHFTARCPFKETMAPADGAADVAAGMGDEPAVVGAKPGGSYVPPAKRAGGGGEGERMGGSGGKFGDRDDLATLRVTNVSEFADEESLRTLFNKVGRVTRVFLAKDRETGLAKGFAFISFADRSDAEKACRVLDGHGFMHLILRVEVSKKTN